MGMNQAVPISSGGSCPGGLERQDIPVLLQPALAVHISKKSRSQGLQPQTCSVSNHGISPYEDNP